MVNSDGRAAASREIGWQDSLASEDAHEIIAKDGSFRPNPTGVIAPRLIGIFCNDKTDWQCATDVRHNLRSGEQRDQGLHHRSTFPLVAAKSRTAITAHRDGLAMAIGTEECILVDWLRVLLDDGCLGGSRAKPFIGLAIG